MSKRILSREEYDAVNQIAERSKMDCWFMIGQDDDGDFVYDLENHTQLSLKEGLTQLAEGIVEPYSFYGLNDEQISAISKLFEEFGIVPGNIDASDEDCLQIQGNIEQVELHGESVIETEEEGHNEKVYSYYVDETTGVMTIYEGIAVMAEVEDCLGCDQEQLFKDVVWEMREIDLSASETSEKGTQTRSTGS